MITDQGKAQIAIGLKLLRLPRDISLTRGQIPIKWRPRKHKATLCQERQLKAEVFEAPYW